MAIEYLGLSSVEGPLVVLEGVQDAFYDEIVEFVNYTKDPQIRNKLNYLIRDVRLLLYYFQLLDLRDKEDILDFMKLKSHKRPHVPDEKRD